jgi:hypothetical protein
VANVVGDSASAEFSAYVAEFENQFNFSAEDVKPSMETSLSEWIRASAWWFLQGRSELESVMRSRAAGAPGNAQRSEQLQQSIIHLAKSWWINNSVIVQHPELTRFGSMSVDAIATLARTSGDYRFSSLLELYQSLTSNLRGLAMSMKRNNIMPSLAEAQHALSSRGVDTAIWIKYPFFSPDVCAVLSGATSRSMLVENSANIPYLVELMPLKDTERIFCYGRMFVAAYISSGEDNSQMYAIPCMLSITRDRSDWNVTAAITSQTELVNLIITSDKKRGQTWSDVRWQVKTCAMTIRLPRGFELDINFNEPDFKMLCKIV